MSADRMAVHIVDLFESIEIEVQQRPFRSVTTSLHDLLFEAVFQQLSIRQACKGIVVSLTVKLFFTLGAGEGHRISTREVNAAPHAERLHIEEPGHTDEQHPLELAVEYHGYQNDIAHVVTEESALVRGDGRFPPCSMSTWRG